MIKDNVCILLSEARQMVRQHFNVESDEQADVIVDAANRGHVRWGANSPTRKQFEAQLRSVRALFEHALVGER